MKVSSALAVPLGGHSWALLPSRPLGLLDSPCGWASPALAAAPKYSAICEKVEIGEKGLFFPGLSSRNPLMSPPPPAANTTRRRLCSWIRLMGQSWPLCWVRVWRLLGVPGAAVHTHPEGLSLWKAGGLKKVGVSLGERALRNQPSFLFLRPQWVLAPWSTPR